MLREVPAGGRLPLWPDVVTVAACLVTACATTGSSQVQPTEGSSHSIQSLQWLDRMTWGPNTALARELNDLGMERFLERQLRHEAGLPASVNDQVMALSIAQQPLDRLVMQLERQRKEADAIVDDEPKKAA